MVVLFGAMLAAGVLLTAAPWLWPAGIRRPAAARTEGRVHRLLQSAGYAHTPPGRLIAACAGAAALAGSIAWLVTGVGAAALVAAVAGGAAPVVWLQSRARRLRRSRRALWPDICDLLIASVRAGMSLPDAVASLSGSAPPPLRPAFARFAGDLAASGHFDSSILRLKTAVADPVCDRIIESVRMARQVGGTELTTVLRGLSSSVRAEAALRFEVEARQSWIRGAAVLGVVAPWVILVLLALRPEGAAAYSSPEGVGLILIGAAVSVVAYRIMLRIGRLPEPRRWFG